jgi:hypothetical protein
LAARILGLDLVPLFLPPLHAPFRLACRGNRMGLRGKPGRLLLARMAWDLAAGGSSEEETGQGTKPIAAPQGRGAKTFLRIPLTVATEV